MALFKAKQQQEVPAFDPVAFREQISTEFAAYVQSALAPIVTAVQALGQQRAQPQDDGQDDDQQQQQQQQRQQGLTAEQVRQIINEQHQSNGSTFVPKSRLQAIRQLRNNLTERGRELFDKYGDEVEAVIDNVAPQHQSNPQAWEQAFEFAMINNHKPEYVKILMEDAKPEDLPPHLQAPVGQGSVEVDKSMELSEDEKVIQPIFDRSYKGGFSAKQMREYGDLNSNFSMTMDQMIAAAKEKGLIANGTGTNAETNKGNNA